MKIDTMSFCEKYHIDNHGKYGQYKHGKCAICGKDTNQVDATLLWDGLVTYLCSDKCHDVYWKED